VCVCVRVTSLPLGGMEYYDERVCLCLSVCPRAHLRKYMADLRQICVCVCVNLWPWLGPPLASLRYVMYFRFMDDVIFAHT